MGESNRFKTTLFKKQRTQWLLFCLVFCVLAFLGCFNLYRTYRQGVRQEESHILTQTRVIARNMERQISVTDQVLREIVRDSADLRLPANRDRARKRFQLLATALAGVRTIFIADAAGTIQVSNRPELEGKNFAQREYYQTSKATRRSDLLYISTPFKSVLGAYVMNLTRIITTPDGQFDGIVSAGIDPDYFSILLKSVLYAPDMIATINHFDGIRFMIEPRRNGQAGKNLAVPGSMFTRHKQSKRAENIFTDIGYATGEYRTMALVTLSALETPMDKPPIIIAGRSRNAILAPWRYDAAWQITGYFIALLVAAISLRRHQIREQEKAQTAHELAELRQKFVDIFEFLPDPTLVVDNSKKVVAWNRAMEELTGIPKAEMLGKGDNAYSIPFYGKPCPNLIDLLDTNDQELTSRYSQVQRTGTTLAAEAFCPALHNGKGAHVWALVAPLHDAEGNRVGAIETIRDISAIKKLEADLTEANRRLAEQARIDELTGIYNRRMFRELLQAELARACRYKTPLSLIMFDIDHFKKINDSRGHNIGDHVLKEIARLVGGRIRSHDIFGRWGGEEFLILTPKNDIQQATQLAEILRELIAEHDFGDGLRVTASFGVTGHTCQDTTEAFVERADKALYDAKTKGRNRVETS